MNTILQRLLMRSWSLVTKIGLLVAIGGLLSIGGVIWLIPTYQQLLQFRHQHTGLEQQWQTRHQQFIQGQQLQQELTILNYQHGLRLHALQQTSSLAALINRITILIKSQHLQLLTLKPQQNQRIDELTQQAITLDIQGTEPGILNFLQLLTHQPWLADFQQLQFSATASGMHLQATFVIYYA